MKIVVVSQPGYPSPTKPFRLVFVHELCRKLQKRGLKVAAVAGGGAGAKELYQEISVYRLGRPFQYQLSKIIDIEKPHILHIHFADSAISGVVLGRLFLRKTIIHCHRDDVDPNKKLWIRLLRNIAFKFCHQVIAVSNATSLLAQQCGAGQAKIQIIYNSANEDLYVNQISRSDARNRIGLPSGIPILLAIGNLIERKGFNYLIDAVAQIEKPVKMIIVGEGVEKERLEELIAARALESKVILWGPATMNDLVYLYKAADVFVHPSLHEGHSLVLLEAMVSGLPIIATRVPGNTETIQDGVNGILVPPRDSLALSIAMTTLIEDNGERERLSKNSTRLYFENFGEDVQVSKLLNLYGSLVGMKAT